MDMKKRLTKKGREGGGGYKFLGILLLFVVGIIAITAAPVGTKPIPGHNGSQIQPGTILGDRLADNLNLTGNVSINDVLFIKGSKIGVGVISSNYLLETSRSSDGKDVNLSGALYVNGTSRQIYAGGYNPIECPAGMILVPPSHQDGMDGFCVDKYEAKNISGIATSQAAGTPWVTITQYNARAECIRAGKHLITEKEWQAIAHNIELVGWNWNGGVVGTNQMSDGHSDGIPGSSLAADVTGDPDDDPCVGTGQACDVNTWDSQRRTYKLSNSLYIWDFGGDVWEWVDQVNKDEYPVYNSPAAGWQACSTSGDGICGNIKTTNDQWYRGASLDTRGFIRGGGWNIGANSGAFTLDLNAAPTLTYVHIGFRCCSS